MRLTKRQRYWIDQAHPNAKASLRVQYEVENEKRRADLFRAALQVAGILLATYVFCWLLVKASGP